MPVYLYNFFRDENRTHLTKIVTAVQELDTRQFRATHNMRL